MASERHRGAGCTEQLDIKDDLVRTRCPVVVCLPKVIQPRAALVEQRVIRVALSLLLEPQPVRSTGRHGVRRQSADRNGDESEPRSFNLEYHAGGAARRRSSADAHRIVGLDTRQAVRRCDHQVRKLGLRLDALPGGLVVEVVK